MTLNNKQESVSVLLHTGSETTRPRARGLGIGGLFLFSSLTTLAMAQQPDYPLISNWARVGDAAQAHYVSSYDRSGGNDDGFRGTHSSLYSEQTGRGREFVLVDAQGPGCLYTLWFTSRTSGFSRLDIGRLRLYLDEDSEPRLDVDANEFFSDQKTFRPPMVYSPFQSSGGHVSYIPFCFSKRLKLTSSKLPGFYNAYYVTYPQGADVRSWTLAEGERLSEQLTREWARIGSDPKPFRGRRRAGTLSLAAPAMPDGEAIPARQTLATFDEPGVLTSVRMNPLMPVTAFQLQHVMLHIFWDGEAEPSVAVPLGMFFGSGLGEASVRALPLGMSASGSYYNYLPMPFSASARIELVNTNPEAFPDIHWEVEHIEMEKFPVPSSRLGSLKVRTMKSWPTIAGQDHVLLESEGVGRVVGQVMTVEPIRPEVKRWWEGDLRVFVDASRHPSFHGTGHEDEYLGGWSNEWLQNPYSLPWHGQPKTTSLRAVDFQWSAATTVYRFFPEGIPYRRSIRMTTEHGTDNAATAMYTSAVFYYERPSRQVRVSGFGLGDENETRGVDYQAPGSESVELESDFVAGANHRQSLSGRRVPERASFVFQLSREYRGLVLRRLFDQSERQSAEIWVNGRLVGLWRHQDRNAFHRFAESDFMIPDDLGEPDGRLEIELRVVAGSWVSFGYELWADPVGN